jgi:uncharacterized DUF497 family protein
MRGDKNYFMGRERLDEEMPDNYNVCTGELRFSWDDRKEALNRKKHGVSFIEAASVFLDRFYLEIPDPDHSTDEEERFIAMGLSAGGKVLIVCHCIIEPEETVRIISARKATTNEAKQYGGKTNAKRI